MTKPKDKTPHQKETKNKESKDKEPKGKSNLVGRVKKVIKKSRRKLGEEKFEKELQRTIEFLAQLQVKLDSHPEGKENGRVAKKTEKNPAKRTEKKITRREAKKTKPGKKSVKKNSRKSANKKARSATPKIAGVTTVVEPVVALQAEAQSTGQQSGDQ